MYCKTCNTYLNGLQLCSKCGTFNEIENNTQQTNNYEVIIDYEDYVCDDCINCNCNTD